jgi:hypothetical protein
MCRRPLPGNVRRTRTFFAGRRQTVSISETGISRFDRAEAFRLFDDGVVIRVTLAARRADYCSSSCPVPLIRASTLLAVKTPMMNPATKAPKSSAARGIVMLKNRIFVSTDAVFCRTTINTNRATIAMAAILIFYIMVVRCPF